LRLAQARAAKLEVRSVPQQTNSSDCGVYVLAFSEQLARTLQRGRDPWAPDALRPVTPGFVRALRTELRGRIDRLHAQRLEKQRQGAAAAKP
jgi:Ulp1 family protease